MMRPKRLLKDDKKHIYYSQNTYWGEYHRIFTQTMRGWMGPNPSREDEYQLTVFTYSVGNSIKTFYNYNQKEYTWTAKFLQESLNKRYNESSKKVTKLMNNNYNIYI